MNLKENLAKTIQGHAKLFNNIPREEMIEHALANKEAIIAESGALATWTPPESTGRSPKDTVTVKRAISEKNIDWISPNNIPIDEETFNMAFEDGLNFLKNSKKIYETDRVIGADSSYAFR